MSESVQQYCWNILLEQVSVYEQSYEKVFVSQELGDLVSMLETKNLEAFSELRESLNREVKAETFLV